MSFEEYLYIVVPYSFIMFLIIVFYAYQLKVFKYGYTIGFMGTIWSGYEFIAFPLIGFFYFKHVFDYVDSSLFYLMLFLIIVYFSFMFVGFQISAKSYFFKNLFSKVSLEKTSRKLSLSVNVKILLFVYFILSSYTFYNNYLMYGTIDSFKILTTLNLLEESSIVEIQKGVKLYINAIASDLIRLIFIILLAMLIYKKKVFFSLVLLLFHFYMMLSFRSKYVLIYPLFFIALYSFYIKKVPLKYVFSFLLVLAFGGIYIINTLRHGGDLTGFSFDSIHYLLSVVIWRADFFHGFYALLEKLFNDELMISGGITIFSMFFRIIPRSIWPDRLGSTDNELTQVVFGEFQNAKGWAFNFGGIGEFIYSFHLPGIIIIAIFAGVIIYTMNQLLIKSIYNGNFILVGFILANPIWFMPWNIGINDYFGRKFIFAFLAYYLLILIISYFNRIRIK